MRIGICAASMVRMAKRAGMGRYTKNLIQCLAKLDSQNHYVLFLSRDNAMEFRINQPNFQNVIVPLPPREERYFEQLILPPYLYWYNLDIVHYLGWAGCLAYRGKSVMTIHDVNYIFLHKNWRSRFYYNHLFRKSAYLVDKIITVSKSAKSQISQFLQMPEEKIKMIYEAASPSFSPVEYQLLDEVQRRYGIGGRYILGVGTLEPNKNFRGLLRAYHLVRERMQTRIQLVLVGQKGWDYSELLSEFEDSRYRRDIIRTGYVSDNDLVALYTGAEVFVFPSFYEGFGLPVLEAMSCGTPVITSNSSSLPEVVGDAGLLIDPRNIQEIVEAIMKILHDESLQQSLSSKALKRAQCFSWDRCVQETIEVYQRVVYN